MSSCQERLWLSFGLADDMLAGELGEAGGGERRGGVDRGEGEKRG